jgi:hypothetical protein
MAGYMHGGLEKNRYIIQKTNGKPVDPEAQYFVLRVDKDPHARVALAFYAQSVRRDNPQLADDIERWIEELLTWTGDETGEHF